MKAILRAHGVHPTATMLPARGIHFRWTLALVGVHVAREYKGVEIACEAAGGPDNAISKA